VTVIAAMVVVTSIVGSFTAKYCTHLRRGFLRMGRKKPSVRHAH